MTATPWGFRDILPEEAQAREEIALTVKRCFREHHYLRLRRRCSRTRVRRGRRPHRGTRRSSFLMYDGACWWSVPTTRCRSFAWFRLACARPICRCACAMRRRSVRECQRNAGGSRQFTQLGFELIGAGDTAGDVEFVARGRGVCASWRCPMHALSQVACVRLRNCSRRARIASWPPRPCAACTPTTLWASMPAWRQAPSPMPSRPPLASCRVCTAVPRYSTAWTRCWRPPVSSRR